MKKHCCLHHLATRGFMPRRRQFDVAPTISCFALALFFTATSTFGSETAPSSACAEVPPGVVSWWRAENTAQDSASHNNGVLMGNATYGPGLSGTSFVFDGDRDGVMVGTGTNLHLQNFTIETWVKRASESVVSSNGNGNAQIFAAGALYGGFGFWIEGSGNHLGFGKLGKQAAVSSHAIRDTNWHHIAVTKQANRVVFYLDGIASSAQEFDPGIFSFTTPAYIGTWLNPEGHLDNSFLGQVDELAIYGCELSPDQLVQIYRSGRAGKCPAISARSNCTPIPLDLMSWWRAEEDEFDSHDVNHGTICGSVSYGSGKVGQCFVLNDQHAGIKVGASWSAMHQDFSIELWVKRASPQAATFGDSKAGYLVSLGIAGNGFGLHLRSDDSLAFGKLQVNEVVTEARISDTAWHHVVLSKSGGEVTIYLDARAYPAAYTSRGFDCDGPGCIGGQVDLFGQVVDSFLGSIDEVSFYRRPLQQAEVLSLFNAGNTGKCPTLSPPVIKVQPRSLTVIEGDYLIISASTKGTPPLSFQWRKYGTPISGATGLLFSIPQVQLIDAGAYTLSISNKLGTTTSATMPLTVTPVADCLLAPDGLIAWWNGENDSIEHTQGDGGNSLRQAGRSWGKVGLAFSFNGYSQCIRIKNGPELNPRSSLSIECWIYLEQYSTNDVMPIANKYDIRQNKPEYSLGIGRAEDGNWLASTMISLPNGTAILRGITRIGLRQWYHTAMTYGGGKLRLFVNGELESQQDATGPITIHDNPFEIGGHAKGPWKLNGRVDELSLYDRALTPSEIKSIYLAGGAGKCPLPGSAVPLPPGLIGWWRGESNSLDSVAVPLSGSSGQPTFTRGQVGSAYRFSSETVPLSSTNNSPPSLSALTLTSWVLPEKCPTNRWARIVGSPLHGSAAFQFALESTSAGAEAGFRARTQLTGGEVLVESTTSTALDSWSHLAMTYDGNELRLYVNGVLEGRGPSHGSLVTTELPLMLGGGGNGILGFVGCLDEVGLFNRALDSHEIAEIFIAGKAGKSFADVPFDVRDLRKWFFGSKPNPTPTPEH